MYKGTKNEKSIYPWGGGGGGGDDVDTATSSKVPKPHSPVLWPTHKHCSAPVV